MVNIRDKNAIQTDILRRLKNEKALREKMENYESGIIEAPLTSYEDIETQLNNNTAVNKKLAEEVYKIFSGDTKQSEAFLDMLRTNGILYSDFTKVSDDLINRFRGKLVLAPAVYRVMTNLIENINTTGTTQATKQNTKNFDELKDYIDTLYDAKKITKSQGEEAKQLIEATEYATSLDFKSKYEQAMKNNNLLKRKILKPEIKKLMDINSLQDDSAEKPILLLDHLDKIKNIIQTEIYGSIDKTQKKANDNLDKFVGKIENEKDLTDVQKLIANVKAKDLKTILGVLGNYNYKQNDSLSQLQAMVDNTIKKVTPKILKKNMMNNDPKFIAISGLNKSELVVRLIKLQYDKPNP